ncbi:MAG: SDR family NAD(P)-dependent oxidoreductase [Rhizobiaceae bacterium]
MSASDTKLLAGKTAVVTGASRGIGRAIALTFAKAGADLAVVAQSPEKLAAVASEIEAEGVRCHQGFGDLSDSAATEKVCSGIVDALGSVDILVNNAGIHPDYGVSFADGDPDVWWRTIEVNIRGVYLVTRRLLDSINEGGKVINMSSGMGLTPAPNQSSYVVSKAGLNILTEVLANELWPRKIDVNNLIPGPVATEMFNWEGRTTSHTTEQVLEKFEQELPPLFPPQERMKHPNEVADMALYLATRPVGGPTGQTYSLARRPL